LTSQRIPTDYNLLRLRDRIRPGVRILFVGINPGVRSAITGHHFAGFSNRFWKLLYDSRLVPVPITYQDDDRLPEWGYGITNIVPRATPGMNDLRPEEYRAGARVLLRKVKRYEPGILALVGVTVWRALLEAMDQPQSRTRVVTLGLQNGAGGAVLKPGRTGARGPQHAFPAWWGGRTRIFVLPNPSGRNANYSYEEMLAAFTALRVAARR
jgi:double-stranded uracil-DNA glycosylase